ncbi:MAG: hypothetical protein JO306_08115 [Gemmatimonadetes bacterium]|nr:hypothetical protein [Gemmatimonadota bacterium]
MDPLILYSANTLLAYSIAERFYRGVHYAWCSPLYDGTRAAAHINIPPSSSPAELYRIYAEDARRGELHSELFDRNRRGVKGGAKVKRDSGVITDDDVSEIEEIVARATAYDMRPLLYIIPYDRVADQVLQVPVADRAHPLSVEFRIEELPRDCFDVIELRS